MRLLVVVSLISGFASSEIIGLKTKSLRSGDELKSSFGPLRLIAMRFCPWCERVLLTLARKNISVEVVNVNLSNKPEFLFEKHPEGKVPVLEHNGQEDRHSRCLSGQNSKCYVWGDIGCSDEEETLQTIIDSALIAEYLDWIHPETSVLPADPYLRAKQRMIASIIEARMPSAVRSLISELQTLSQKEAVMRVLHDALNTAEKQLNNTFYGGSDAGFADYMTYPFMERIWIWTHEPKLTDLRTDAFPSDVYPKLQKWFSRMRSRREVASISLPLWQHRLFNQGYVTGNPDFDAGLDLRRTR